jgi:hypothetical protein
MFSYEQPDANQVPRDFVGQKLSNTTFNTVSIAQLIAYLILRSMSLDLQGCLCWIRTTPVEFFLKVLLLP